jgi:hypothetical protein
MIEGRFATRGPTKGSVQFFMYFGFRNMIYKNHRLGEGAGENLRVIGDGR